jgi:hypothetical protein
MEIFTKWEIPNEKYYPLEHDVLENASKFLAYTRVRGGGTIRTGTLKGNRISNSEGTFQSSNL